jgi:hypothetical protein
MLGFALMCADALALVRPLRRLQAVARIALPCVALIFCLSSAGALPAHGGVWGGIKSGSRL